MCVLDRHFQEFILVRCVLSEREASRPAVLSMGKCPGLLLPALFAVEVGSLVRPGVLPLPGHETEVVFEVQGGRE